VRVAVDAAPPNCRARGMHANNGTRTSVFHLSFVCCTHFLYLSRIIQRRANDQHNTSHIVRTNDHGTQTTTPSQRTTTTYYAYRQVSIAAAAAAAAAPAPNELRTPSTLCFHTCLFGFLLLFHLSYSYAIALFDRVFIVVDNLQYVYIYTTPTTNETNSAQVTALAQVVGVSARSCQRSKGTPVT
jgi:hypothetical protein